MHRYAGIEGDAIRDEEMFLACNSGQDMTTYVLMIWEMWNSVRRSATVAFI